MSDYNPTIVTECLRIVVCTRNRNFNNDEYQKNVVEPYNKIQKMQDQLEKDGASPTDEQSTQALEMLKQVFAAKQVPEDEQKERFTEVLEKTNTMDKFKNVVL